MSKVRVISFTVGRDGGWSVVTPIGLIQAERGQQVTIALSDTWEDGAKAIRVVCESTKEGDNVA